MTEAPSPGALHGVRVCDLSGQLAGAGATRIMAAFGAEVIRIEDPVTLGKWDLLRGAPPFVDGRRGNDLGGAFNQHNVEKLGITLNTRTERGKELLAELIRVSDIVTENFAPGVVARWGFTYERMRELRPDVIYLSNCGFGHTGPYGAFRSWGPVVQAVSGLTFASGHPGMLPAGWGYSYMDHMGAYMGALAVLAAMRHRQRTGEGQWIDLSTVEAGATLHGPAILDASVNGYGLRANGSADSNHSARAPMAPHSIYPAAGDDEWVAIACRDDADWQALARVIDRPWTADARWATITGRQHDEHELDGLVAGWTREHDKFKAQSCVLAAGVPAAAVQRPHERIDHDPSTAAWGLWPTVEHAQIGRVRVDGIPVHLSETDWHIERGAPVLGQHNDYVYGEILGLSTDERAELHGQGVI